MSTTTTTFTHYFHILLQKVPEFKMSIQCNSKETMRILNYTLCSTQKIGHHDIHHYCEAHQLSSIANFMIAT